MMNIVDRGLPLEGLPPIAAVVPAPSKTFMSYSESRSIYGAFKTLGSAARHVLYSGAMAGIKSTFLGKSWLPKVVSPGYILTKVVVSALSRGNSVSAALTSSKEAVNRLKDGNKLLECLQLRSKLITLLKGKINEKMPGSAVAIFCQNHPDLFENVFNYVLNRILANIGEQMLANGRDSEVPFTLIEMVGYLLNNISDELKTAQARLIQEDEETEEILSPVMEKVIGLCLPGKAKDLELLSSLFGLDMKESIWGMIKPLLIEDLLIPLVVDANLKSVECLIPEKSIADSREKLGDLNFSPDEIPKVEACMEGASNLLGVRILEQVFPVLVEKFPVLDGLQDVIVGTGFNNSYVNSVGKALLMQGFVKTMNAQDPLNSSVNILQSMGSLVSEYLTKHSDDLVQAMNTFDDVDDDDEKVEDGVKKIGAREQAFIDVFKPLGKQIATLMRSQLDFPIPKEIIEFVFVMLEDEIIPEFLAKAAIGMTPWLTMKESNKQTIIEKSGGHYVTDGCAVLPIGPWHFYQP